MGDGDGEIFLRGAGADHGAQIGGVLMAKAGVENAGAGEPDPVAGFAEIVTERSDEAQPSARLGHPHIARGTAGGERQVGEGPETLQVGAHLG